MNHLTEASRPYNVCEHLSVLSHIPRTEAVRFYAEPIKNTVYFSLKVKLEDSRRSSTLRIIPCSNHTQTSVRQWDMAV